MSKKEHISELKNKAYKVKADIEDYVDEHPKRSLLIAGGLGLVIGCLCGKLLRCKR